MFERRRFLGALLGAGAGVGAVVWPGPVKAGRSWGEGLVRRGLARRMRIHVSGTETWRPRVVDVDTGEELTRRIPIRWEPRFRRLNPGDQVRFTLFRLNAQGKLHVVGDRIALEIALAQVVTVSGGVFTGTERRGTRPPGGRVLSRPACTGGAR